MLVKKGHRFLFTVDTVLQLSPCHRLHMNSLRYSCYLLTIDQVSTDHRPSVDQLTDTSVKYRRSIGEVSVNEKLHRPRHTWNDYRPCLDRVSSDYRPSLDRLSTAISTESRPTIDRVSTDYRPTIDRYIDLQIVRHYLQ